MLGTHPQRLTWSADSCWANFEWRVRKDGHVDLVALSNGAHYWHKLVDCNLDDEIVRHIMTLWRAQRPNERTPDILAIPDNYYDSSAWIFTRTGKMMFRVHIYPPLPGLTEEEMDIDDAGVIKLPFYNWRLLRLYTLFVGYLLRDLLRAAEKLFHPDGEGAIACANRFKSIVNYMNL